VTDGRVLVPGAAEGPALVLEDALSLWGGIDPSSGRIIDPRHPQRGATVAGTVLVMASGRGSSSSSTVLAEALRAGTGPAAIVLNEPDPILALGAIVARELYGIEVPVVVSSITASTGDRIRVDAAANAPPTIRPI
jgi:predicted aconitase with swiveling domain